MATIAPVTNGPEHLQDRLLCQIFKWTLDSTNTSGLPAKCKQYRSLEVQIKGTWNTGTLTIQGSDDGTNYLGLRSLATMSAISQTADPTTLIVIFECPAYVKPVLAGAGTDSIVVTLIARN